MHPGGFEEAAVVIAGGKRLSVFVEYDHVTGFFSEFHHVVAQTGHPGREGRLPVGRLMAALDGFVVPVTLQLSAPQTSKVDIKSAIVIAKHAGIDRIASPHGGIQGLERPLRTFRNGHPDAEDVVLVLQRKVEVVFAILVSAVRIPQLSPCPGNLLHMKGDTVVSHLPIDTLHREYMIIVHVVMVTVIIYRNL